MIKEFFDSLFGGNSKNMPPQKLPSNKFNIISFYIDEWSRSHIYINMEQTNEFAAAEFGKLLYLINSGKYEQNILDQIVELSEKKPLLKKPIQESLVSWATAIKTNVENENDNSVPYVRPTQVFK
jgi:hypothetical protein